MTIILMMVMMVTVMIIIELCVRGVVDVFSGGSDSSDYDDDHNGLQITILT